MARDHYLPAAFIGRFSDENQPRRPARERKVWVARVPSPSSARPAATRCRASAIGYSRGLYGMPSQHLPEHARNQPTSVDSWRYEPELPRVLDALRDGQTLTLSDWLHVAVPFVAGLFVRGTDFNARYESRLGGISEKIEAASQGWNAFNTNFARTVEMDCLLLPVMAASWTVHHAPLAADIVTNNVGLVPAYDPRLRRSGWAVPLDPRTGLMLLPGSRRCFASHGSKGWTATIEHLPQTPGFFSGLNSAAAQCASEFIVGPTRESVETVSDLLSVKPADQLATVFDLGWSIQTGLSAAARDITLWAQAAAIADSSATLHEVAQGRPLSWKNVDASRWTPTALVMNDGTGAPSHTIKISKKNLYVALR